MEIKKLIKKIDKRTLNIVYFIFLLGICLMTIDISPKEKERQEQEIQPEQDSLEERMEDIFSKIQGVGNVQVLINYKSGQESVLARDTSYTSSEGDTSKSTSTDEKVVFGNNSEPIVLKENSPEIQGVIIVAEGGDSIDVKNRLIRSTQALLGVELHKIEVLKMKS